MIQAEACVICGGVFSRQRRGVVTPFLAHRIWHRRPFPVQLSECGECGFLFFDGRLEPAEEKALYSGYRGPEYQKMRYSFEPWYTEKFNVALSCAESFQRRTASLKALFRDRLRLSGRTFTNVLDFGGDRGDLIADLVPASRRFVYDISGVESVPGVEALRTLEECRRHHFDLIVISNVLEHVGSPRDVVAQVASISGPETLFFDEVPLESVTDLRTRLKRIAQAGVLAVTRPAVAMQVIGSGMFNVMHEHVNYFNSRAHNRLMDVSGFKVLDSGDYIFSPGILPERMAWSLSQKK